MSLLVWRDSWQTEQDACHGAAWRGRSGTAWLFLLLMAAVGVADDVTPSQLQGSIEQSRDWDTAQAWTRTHLTEAGTPPFSFRFADARSVDFLAG